MQFDCIIHQGAICLKIVVPYAALRRKNSAYRRKTNTYAKNNNALQRTLNMQLIVHNFVQIHFTTKQVSAVALGIVDNGLSLIHISKIQEVA